MSLPSPRSSVASVEDLRTGGRWFEPPAWPIFFLRIGESHCNRNHFSHHCPYFFSNSYVGQQPVAWKEHCAEYWSTPGKHGYTGRQDITKKNIANSVIHHII